VLTRLRRSRRSGDERGTAIIELAICLSVLATILFGILDFGFTMTNYMSVRQGVAEAARSASVASFGTDTSCTLNNLTATSGSVTTDMKELACLVKDKTGLNASNMYVAIRFDPNSTSYPSGTSSPPVGNGIIVCAAYKNSALTGLFPMLNSIYLTSKADMRIETASGNAENQVNETDPTGKSWSWCTP
jgi:Flp pilus assembly protein TadG